VRVLPKSLESIRKTCSCDVVALIGSVGGPSFPSTSDPGAVHTGPIARAGVLESVALSLPICFRLQGGRLKGREGLLTGNPKEAQHIEPG